MVWLVLPSIAWGVNCFLPRRIHPAILFAAVGVICYALMTASILGEFSDYERELMEYDLNGDGDLDRSELTPAAMEVQDKIASDTGRMFGPIFAAPIAVIWVTINFVVLYGGEYTLKRFSAPT